jgi:hypothetical protein
MKLFVDYIIGERKQDTFNTEEKSQKIESSLFNF